MTARRDHYRHMESADSVLHCNHVSLIVAELAEARLATHLPPVVAMLLHFGDSEAHHEYLQMTQRNNMSSRLSSEPNWWRCAQVDHGVDVDIAACLPRLRRLRLISATNFTSRTLFTAPSPTLSTLASVARLQHLQYLRIDRVDDNVTLYFPCSPSLREIDLSGTQVTNECLLGLAALPRLEVLNLSGCKRITDVSCLRSSQSLRSIDASNTNVTNAGIQGLEWIPCLLKVSFAFCAAVSSVAFLRVSKSLRELDLLGSNVRMVGIDTLADAIPTLRKLSLSWCGTVQLR